MNIRSSNSISLEVDGAKSLTLPAFSLKAQHRVLRFTLMTTDGLMLIAALLLASWLRFELRIGLSTDITVQPNFYTVLMAVLVPLPLAVFALFRTL